LESLPKKPMGGRNASTGPVKTLKKLEEV